jgi:hypothetical protein
MAKGHRGKVIQLTKEVAVWVVGQIMVCLNSQNYPKLAVPEMGKFTQKWYGQKWVKI